MLSATNGVCGILAIMYAIDGAFEFASALILAAMVFDGLDGAVARALGIKSPIGRDIDSIADMVSFCIAPAVLIYAWHYDPSAGTSLKILQGYTEGRAVNLLTVVASGGGMLLGMYRLMRFRTTDYGLDHF
ncbi:MAG TPA: hypothetical protein EYP43_04810, partial [Thermoplasmata archaeon]|nr:hypothetical protein [Thermoplasmata archaeon]